MKLEAWDIEDAAQAGDVARILQIFSRHFPRQDFGAAEGWDIRYYYPGNGWFRVHVRLGPQHDPAVFTCMDGLLFLRLTGGALGAGAPTKLIVVEGRVPYRRVL